MEDAKRPYSLYLIKPEDIPTEEKHYIRTPDWCLLYSQNEPTGTHREITDLSRLPALAWEWLESTIQEIRKEYLETHREEILRKAKSFHERFAAELEKEASLAKKEGESDERSESGREL